MNWTMNAEQAANFKALRRYVATRLSALEYNPDKFSTRKKQGCIISQAYYDRALPKSVLDNMDKTKLSCVNDRTVFSRAEQALEQAYGDGSFDFFAKPPHSRLDAMDEMSAILKANGTPYGILFTLTEFCTPRKIAALILLATIAYFAKMFIVGFLIGAYICGALVNNYWNPVNQIKAYYNLFRCI